MVVRPATKRPAKLAGDLGDGMLIDARNAALHQPVCVELPVLVAICAKPMAAVVVIFIGKPYSDAVTRVGPYFLDEAIIEFS